MKSKKKLFLFNSSPLMKNVHKHITSLSNFYIRHRRMFVMIKVVILAGIMTFAFSIQNDNGKFVYHGTANTYADSLCGNGKCDNNTAYCSLSSTDCTKINTGSCAGITGCSVNSKTIESCKGTIFSCSAIVNSTICSDVGCSRKDNICSVPLDSKGNPTPQTCASRSAAQCTVLKNKGLGTCYPSIVTTESCLGTIATPKNENDCTKLNNTPFAPTTKRYPEYIENQSSCAMDCAPTTLTCMGNEVEFLGKTTCGELNISYPETSCKMYYSSSYQCAYDSNNNKCMEGASCNVASTQICGNGAKEGTEICDDGNKNGQPGYCNDSCNGNFNDTLLVVLAGTIGGNNWNAANTGTQMQNIGSGVYKFSITLNQGTYQYKVTLHGSRSENYGANCKANGNDKNITIPSDNYLVDFYFDYTTKLVWDSLSPDQCSSICGNGIREGTEICDNGVNNSDTQPGACATTCTNYITNTPVATGFSTKICSGVTEIPQSECVQLVNIYNSTSGNSWTNSGNRGNTGNICRNKGSKGFDYSGSHYTGNDKGRYGILCIDKHVAGLGFKDNNLVGNFKVDFYQLPNLVVLAIPGNTGLQTIDASISGAQSLTIFNLEGGIGEFPAGIAYLQNLEYIGLDDVGTEEMRYMPGLFPKLKGISLVGNYLTTVSGALATLRPNLEYVDFSNNCIDTGTLSTSLISFINDKQTTTNPDRASQQSNCRAKKPVISISTTDPNGQISLFRDNKFIDGTDIKGGDTIEARITSNNGYYISSIMVDGSPLAFGPTISYIYTFYNISSKHTISANFAISTPVVPICGNNIIESMRGEVCDNGMNNGKPGQCNKTCNGRETFNLFCGDSICKSSCSLTGSLTCANLNTINEGKDLCTALGCSLQYADNSSCDGTVSCSDIIPEKFWGSLEGAQKYCSIAGCGWDKTKSICTLPKDNKKPSCDNIGVSLGLTNTTEYCPRLPGCNLIKNNKTPNTICVGGILPRADKLNQTQCTTLEGTRNTEDVTSCNVDCKGTCSGLPTDKKKCNELSVAECSNTYALAEGVNGINCVVQEEKGKQICTNEQYTCTTCDNKICDDNESEKSCPSDCLGEIDWPKILYSSNAPKDGSLVTGKVEVSVYLPPQKNCKIINNNSEGSYSFKYNGYYIFQVNCPWFDKPWDLVAKVYWLQGNTIGAVNTKDIASGTSGSNIYYENKRNLITDVTTNTTMATITKKYMYEQALNTAFSSNADAQQISKEIILNKNISFLNDSNVYQKVLLEGNLIDTTSTTQATLTIPADVTIKSETNGKQTNFSGVLIAPTTVTGSILNAFSSSSGVENVDTVIKVGDQNNNKLVAVDSSGATTEFSLTIETKAPVGSTIQVYSSQDGKTRTYYGEAIVKTDGINNYVIVDVPHLTYYGITSPTGEENPEGGQESGTNNGGNTNNGGGGGGEYSALIKDICPAQRDCSSSYYDHLCGPCTTTTTGTKNIHGSATPYCPTYSSELNQAYGFAFDNGITTIADCDKVNLDGQLLRSHMAKMISNFAINTLEMQPNTGTACNFTDMSKESDEMKFYSKIACQLGLMGMNDQGIIKETFNPNENVTRAQFGTVLSRLIRQNENNGGTPYYTKHLQALKTAGIMTKIDEPTTKELRGFVMVMLQRITSQISPAENGSKTLRELVKDFFSKK